MPHVEQAGLNIPILFYLELVEVVEMLEELVMVPSSGVGGSGLPCACVSAIGTEVCNSIGGGMTVVTVSPESRVSFILYLAVRGDLGGIVPASRCCLVIKPENFGFGGLLKRRSPPVSIAT